MEVKIPESVNIVELETAPFKKYSEAKRWARDHGIVGVMSDADTNGKGDIAISVASISKMLCGAAVRKSVTPAIHYSALVRLRDIIRESFVAEIHPDYKKVGGKRSTSNPVNGKVDIAVLYGCVALGGIDYRAKTTVKIFTASPAASKAYSYEISNIEILRGYVGTEVQPRDKISIATHILLNGVCDVNGAPLQLRERHPSTWRVAEGGGHLLKYHPKRCITNRKGVSMKSIKSNCRKVSCAFGCAAVVWLAGAFSTFAEPIAPSDDAAVNTAAIQAAIDAAVEAGGGVVELDEGVFPINARIEVKAGVTLSGKDREKTVIKQTEKNVSGLSVAAATANLPAAAVEKLTITGVNSNSSSSGNPSGVTMAGGSMSYCIVSNNTTYNLYAYYGSGIQVSGNGVRIDHTIIQRNRNTFRGKGGGLRVAKKLTGTVIDTCLISDNGGLNVAQGSGAGIYCESSTVLLNCTIAGNAVGFNGANYCNGGGAYFDAKCYVTNCIFSGNQAPYDDKTGKPNWAGTTPVGANNFFGDGCATFGDSPQEANAAGFRDAANGDYSLTAVSGAKGQGFWYADIPVDIAGVERMEPADIGCYAYDASKEPFSCPAQMLKDKAFIDQPVGFKTELVNPPEGGEFSYVWTLTDQFGNARSLADSAAPNEVIPAAGFYTVSLEVKDLHSPATANFTIPETLHIAVRTNYVTSVKDAVPVYPYDTPEKATTSLNAAIAETIDGSTVILDEGTHDLTATVELDKEVSVLGAGRDKTTVNAGKRRAFYLHHGKALLEGLGITGGLSQDSGKTVGAAVCISGAGGKVRSCAMFGNASSLMGDPGDIVSISSEEALVECCVITNNAGTSLGGDKSSMIYVGSGVLRNTLIVDNRGSYRDKTLAIDCSVVRVGGSGTLENCTVVSNRTVGTGAISVALYLSSGATVRNTIISDNIAENNVLPETEYISVPNWASEVKASTLTMVSNCAVGDGCAPLGANPVDGSKILFKDAANGDWHLRQGSSCIGKGLNAKWMETAVDLDGKPRLQGRHVDLGCYEADPRGLMILLY